MRKYIAAFLMMVCLSVTNANAIINGDFATGDFTGWTVSAFNDLSNPLDPNDFITVTAAGLGNTAQFDTRPFSEGLFIATLEQTFTLAIVEPILRFDFSLPTTTADATGTGTSPFFDALVVSVENDLDFFELLLVDQFGALADPFGTAPGTVTLGTPLDPLFDFGLIADLSPLVGETITLFVELIQEDDGFQGVFDPTNFRTTVVDPTHIPEPTTLALMGLGLAGIGYRRHCSKKAA